jgi:hypothetical protein
MGDRTDSTTICMMNSIANRGIPMPITIFLEGQKFDPETRRVMGVAFEMARVALGQDWGDHANEIIARRTIELAKAGERNPDVLCERVLAHFRERRVQK